MAKFLDTLKEEYQKNKNLNQGLRQLQLEEGKKRAKELYNKAKDTSVPGGEQLKKVAGKVSDVAGSAGRKISETISEAAESDIAKASAEKIKKAGTTIHSATEPIRQSQVYSAIASEVAEFVEDTGGRYGGYHDKVTRRTRRGIAVDDTREQLEKKASNKAEVVSEAAKPEDAEGSPAGERSEAATGGDVLQGRPTKARVVFENLDAGSSVVLHRDSKWQESWKNFKENNIFIQSIFNVKRQIDESDHPVFNAVRRIADTFSGVLAENETAQAIALLRDTVDPRFNLERFMKEAREYIVPELLDAYLKGDQAALREWCSEATLSVLTAGVKNQIAQGLVSDCRIRDLRNVEFMTAKVLENRMPALVITFCTQEVIMFRDKKTGEIRHGQEDNILSCRYSIVLAKCEEDLSNPITSGWRVLDMAKQESRFVI